MRHLKIITFLMIFLVFFSQTLFSKNNNKAKTDNTNFTIDFGMDVTNTFFIGKEEQNIYLLNVLPYINNIFSKTTNLLVKGKFFYIKVLEPPEDSFVYKQHIDLEELFFKSRIGDNIDLEVGRKYYKIGSGIVFNNISDGFQLGFSTKGFYINALANYTGLLLQDTNPFNFDYNDFTGVTEEVSDGEINLGGAERIFAGIVPGLYLGEHEIYGLFIYSPDFEDDKLYKYTTFYGGLGFKGSIISGLGYHVEGIYQGGTSPISDSVNPEGETATIQAFAVFTELKYLIDHPSKVQVSVKYAAGSGDKDRENAYLSNGNTYGKDTLFKSFGLFYRGFSARPEIGNIQLAGLTISGNPFYSLDGESFKHFLFGIQSYSYFKDDGVITGSFGISNTFDVQDQSVDRYGSDKYLGSTLDMFIRWQISSDLYFAQEFGVFFHQFDYNGDDKSILSLSSITLMF